MNLLENQVMNLAPQETLAILVMLGVICLTIDIVILGFSSLYLNFIGMGAIFTGIMVIAGMIDPNDWSDIILTVALSSPVFTLLSWPAIKRLQNISKRKKEYTKNDMVGQQFYLDADLAVGKPISQRYSGLNWKVESHDQFYPAGTLVTIKECHVGRLLVTKESEKS